VANIARAEPFFIGDRYWGDGMVRVSGREFPGLLDSPCYKDASSDERKLSCLSCHQMHKAGDDPRSLEEWADDQLKPGMRGNDACVGCHEEFRDVAKLTRHTHHSVGSSGSTCYNCHMPYTTYGLLKAIRSHTISTPSVTESAHPQIRRPNACNLCHLDRTLGWAADHLDEWWKVPKPPLDSDQRTFAASILWLLSGDAGQRALVAWAYGWEDARKTSGTAWMMPYIAPLLVDPYSAVRYIAHRSLRTLPDAADVEYDFLGPLASRESAVAAYSSRWRRGIGARAPPSATSLDPGTFGRLLGSRENRRVNLEE
jgi:hypothetical protein